MPLAGILHDSIVQGGNMLLLLAIILAIAWILGFSVYHVASAAIHILIVLAVISLVLHLIGFAGRRTVV